MKNILTLLTAFFMFISCEKNGITQNIDCSDNVIVNNSFYNSTDANNYTITNVNLEEDLLTLTISSSGCDSNSWKSTLIDANEILESNPIQRNLKMSLENNQACLAVFTRDFSFNIACLKEGESEIILNLHGWNEQIIYN